MTWYANIKILPKILTILGLLGSLTIASAFYAGYQMHVVDDADTYVIEHPDRAIIALSRANRNLASYYAGIYRLATETTEEGNKEAIRDIEVGRDGFKKFMADAVKADPYVKAKADEVSAKVQSCMDGDCGTAIKLGLSTDPAENAKAATFMREKCAPQLTTLV
jgi:hypothetical protein